MNRSAPCACGSGVAYAGCCGPLHRSEREAEDAAALMRSRYAAFVLRDADYLWRTLHSDHDDRARPRDQVLRELREACATNRYLELRILDARASDADGIARVLFHAKVFCKGTDRSFVELSEFACEGGTRAWRYLQGDARPVADVGDLGALTIATFVREPPAR
jgi:SEC-C motif-containing protein